MSDLVRYHNNFIQAVYSTDLIAKKLLIGISHKIQKIDKFGEDIEFNVRELAQLTGIVPDSFKHIKNAVQKLQKTLIEAVNPKNSDEWLSFQLLRDSSYERGKLTVNVSPHMRPFLMELKRLFTTYHIENIKPLHSEYSIRIYEMITQFKSTGHFSIKVTDLRKKLCLENKYKQFSDFRKRILNQACKDLKNNCDKYFEYEVIKIGNTANRINFKIYHKQVYKNVELTDEQLKAIYNTERTIALDEFVKSPTSVQLIAFESKYKDNPMYFEDNGTPKEMALYYFLNDNYFKFPSFEKWKKNQKQ